MVCHTHIGFLTAMGSLLGEDVDVRLQKVVSPGKHVLPKLEGMDPAHPEPWLCDHLLLVL